MAIYHLEAKVVSRGAGRSAVAASAYLSCSRLYNDYDGIQHDYTKKQGLVWQQVFLPEYAPQEWQDREKLWNAAEEVETAKDSRLAREFVVALPIELNREQQIELLQAFIREQFVSDGMCADAAIHDTDGHNPYAHILLTVRPLDEQGKWQYKTEKEYLCVRNGEEKGFTATEFKSAQNDGWEKQYPYAIVLYDAVAGGAGHVRRLVTEDGRCFRQVVEKAIAITKGCNCSPSCYSCLRNYYNQKIHDLLNRKYAYDFLENYYGELEPITNEEFENGELYNV